MKNRLYVRQTVNCSSWRHRVALVDQPLLMGLEFAREGWAPLGVNVDLLFEFLENAAFVG